MSATGRLGVGRGRFPATGRVVAVGRPITPCSSRRSIVDVEAIPMMRATGVPRSVITTSSPRREVDPSAEVRSEFSDSDIHNPKCTVRVKRKCTDVPADRVGGTVRSACRSGQRRITSGRAGPDARVVRNPHHRRTPTAVGRTTATVPIEERPLQSADASDRIAWHVSRQIERALLDVNDEERVQVGIRVGSRPLDRLGELVTADPSVIAD